MSSYYRSVLLRSVAGSVVLMTASGVVQAQDQDATIGDPGVTEVVVTGSRVTRSSFSAPTPVNVINLADIEKAAPANIADFVNQMPQLSGSSTTRTGNGNTSTGTNGLNTLNLRSLGANRTLVLLDGRRVVSSSVNSAVDINNLPSALVARVDVVTGGASAAYGSDAIAGVVNFVLLDKFTGLKGSVSRGITHRNDNETFNGQFTFGTPFASGRGHILFSAEGAYQEGINQIDRNKRKWFNQTNMLSNPNYSPTNGQPQRIVVSNVNNSNVAKGGVITTTALAQTQFGLGGVPMPFELGTLISGPLMVGGNSWFEGDVNALESELTRWSTFGRVSYDLSEQTKLTAEASYGYSQTANLSAYQRYAGNLTMSASNPFLDEAIQDSATQLGINDFRYGYSTFDLGRPKNEATRKTYRAVIGLSGKVFGDWDWDGYYQFGQTDTNSLLFNTTNTARFNEAINAVRDSNGRIVCHSSLANPNNGCIPLNIFGYGVADPEAVAYVKGIASQSLSLKQNVVAFSVNGTPFNAWAGPVSVAAGVEYRKEEVSGEGDPVSAVNGFSTGNFKGTNGGYDVREAFAEILMPLAYDMTFIRSLELNVAGRYTDYSTSGGVNTWKVGLTYRPVDDLRVRVLRSHDIRAANLGELFAAGQTGAQDVLDPEKGLTSIRTTRLIIGNPNLNPERADTFSFGLIYSPSWLPQFNGSIDYYSIRLKDAISSIGAQDLVYRCYDGEQALCANVVRDSNGDITQIIAQPVNVASLNTKGFDVEASFRQSLSDISPNLTGTVIFRVLGSHIAKRTTINGGVTSEAAGENTGSAPKWRWFATASYDKGNFSSILTFRTISKGVYNNTWQSGIDIDNNVIKGASYLDLAGNYKFRTNGSNQIELFAKVENLLDKDPPVVAAIGSASLQTNPALYDVIGRSYRMGIRFRY